MRFVFTHILILFLHSNFAREMKLEIKNRTELAGVPSASGIEFYDNACYIIGDNSAWLYKCGYPFDRCEKYPIYDTTNLINDTIRKVDKPDFEASTIAFKNEKYALFIFGSGSKSPQRDVLIKLDLNNPGNIQSFSLERFYLKLKEAGITELNIEGAVYANEFFYLFNRADNTVIRFGYDEFDQFLQKPESNLKVTLHKFNLPLEQGLQSGFSGACLIPGTQKILFTASLEQTDNWIDDGAILGSYAGVFDLETLAEVNKADVLPVLEDGSFVKVKIESVAVKSMSRQKLTIFMVTDSDGGVSELIEANLFLD